MPLNRDEHAVVSDGKLWIGFDLVAEPEVEVYACGVQLRIFWGSVPLVTCEAGTPRGAVQQAERYLRRRLREEDLCEVSVKLTGMMLALLAQITYEEDAIEALMEVLEADYE